VCHCIGYDMVQDTIMFGDALYTAIKIQINTFYINILSILYDRTQNRIEKQLLQNTLMKQY